MYKRNTKVSPPEITPFQSDNMNDNFISDKKTQSMIGKTVFRALWRRNLAFAAAACLLLVSAMTVASDKLEFPTNDMNVHVQSSAAVAMDTFESHMRKAPRTLSRKMMRPAVEEVNTGSEQIKKTFVGGNDEETTGKMVLDALQSQKQTNAAITRNRMLIKRGDITAKVPGSTLDSAAEQIASLVGDPLFGEGGYVAHRSISENGAWSKHKVQRITELNLRIPSSHFQSSMERIKKIVEETSPNANESPDHKGTITSFSTEGRDVTDEFVDTAARADTLDASRKAIQVLLSRANGVDDVMKIQAELNQLTQQSEILRRRALELENKSELSTVNVRLEEWKEKDATGDDDDHDEMHRWSPLDSAYLASTHVSLLAMFAFDTLSYSLVWSIPCIVMYYLGVFVFSIAEGRA